MIISLQSQLYCIRFVISCHRQSLYNSNLRSTSVSQGVGERSRGEPDLLACSVEHGVETLQEGETVDEVETGAGIGSNVANDQIHIVCRAANVGIKGTRPCLSVCCKLKGCLQEQT